MIEPPQEPLRSRYRPGVIGKRNADREDKADGIYPRRREFSMRTPDGGIEDQGGGADQSKCKTDAVDDAIRDQFVLVISPAYTVELRHAGTPSFGRLMVSLQRLARNTTALRS